MVEYMPRALCPRKPHVFPMGRLAGQDESMGNLGLFEGICRLLTDSYQFMVVRLGFAVITACRPDLLITDEVLAVGDESFQKKCIRWIEQFMQQGGTLLLVSHSMYVVHKLCQKDTKHFFIDSNTRITVLF